MNPAPGRFKYIISAVVSTGSDIGLSPVSRQCIIEWLVLIGQLETNFSKIWIKIQEFESELENVVCNMAAILFPKWQPFCVSLIMTIYSFPRHM